MMHEARADLTMLLGCIYLLIVGAGRWSLDALMQRSSALPTLRNDCSDDWRFSGGHPRRFCLFAGGRPSQISHHAHEPLILVILMVAVEQR